MIKNLNESTKLALQAAIAVTLALLIGAFFHFERSYWAVLTAVVLVSQTWGESIKKALERVVMTILGGCVGTIIYFMVGTSTIAMFMIVLVTVFFAVFFFRKSYLFTVFFITIFIVFLFAMLMGWTVEILGERIIETIIGAVIAVVTTALVFPIRSKRQLPTLLQNFIDSTTNNILLSFAVAQGSDDGHRIEKNRRDYLRQYTELRQNVKIMNYELLYTIYPGEYIKKILFYFNTLLHYTTSLMEISPEIDNKETLPYVQPYLTKSETILKQNLTVIRNKLLHPNASVELQTLDPLRAEFQQTVNSKISQTNIPVTDWFDMLSFFYFMKKINEVLREMAKL